MTRSNLNKTISSPPSFELDISNKMQELYSTSKPKNIHLSEDGTSPPDSQGTDGDICVGVKIKGKDVLGVHSGKGWNYCFLYTSGEILELNSKIRELENKIVNLERKSRNNRS